MKIDVVIGNPPYQEINGGGDIVEKGNNLYGKFVHMAKLVTNRLASFIIPTRWYLGDKGTDNDTREDLVCEHHLRNIVDFNKSAMAFNSVEIAGGVCYFLYDKTYNGECNITHFESESVRNDFKLDFDITNDLVWRHHILPDIIYKIKEVNTERENYSSLVSTTNVFGIDTSVWKKASDIKTEEYNTQVKTSQGMCYINSRDITKGYDIIDDYKVITGNKAPDRGGCNNSDSWNVINKTQILPPGCVCSHTYVVVAHGNKEYCINTEKYLNTKFVRFLILSLLPSTTVSQKVFEHVPIQDFSLESDIDWSQPISDIDKQLYNKYKLNKEEIEYIESIIKPM